MNGYDQELSNLKKESIAILKDQGLPEDAWRGDFDDCLIHDLPRETEYILRMWGKLDKNFKTKDSRLTEEIKQLEIKCHNFYNPKYPTSD